MASRSLMGAEELTFVVVILRPYGSGPRQVPPPGLVPRPSRRRRTPRESAGSSSQPGPRYEARVRVGTMTPMRIHIAADHAGFELKAALVEHLEAAGHDVVDH